jgi:hypothetical protein
MDPVVSFPKADGHDGPGLNDEPVPGVAAVIDDIAARSEDAVRQPIVAEVLPDILGRIMPQSGCRGSFSTASTRYYSACCSAPPNSLRMTAPGGTNPNTSCSRLVSPMAVPSAVALAC